MKRKLLLGALVGLMSLPALSQAMTYEIDRAHSTVSFKVRHLLTKVRGRFDAFKGTLEYVKGKPKSWKVNAEIEANSINTNLPDRDKHLRSADFFEVKKYPKIMFKSKKIKNVKGNRAKLHGDLTIHGVTKPVVLDMEIGGIAKDPWGNTKAAFSAVTKINRKDFGLVWNKVLETGGVLVGEEIEIELEIEADLQESKK